MRVCSRSSYQGIRPAPGYPACPEHTEKLAIWDLLDVEERPRASRSRSRWRCGPAPRSAAGTSRTPRSQYFVVGRLGQDQVEDYARRKGWTLPEAEKWLSANLGYQPDD